MELPKTSMREFYAVQRAVAETERLPSGAERLGLVSLVFWRQTHSLEGAAQELHLSYRTARRYHEEFIKLVGAAFGLMDM